MAKPLKYQVFELEDNLKKANETIKSLTTKVEKLEEYKNKMHFGIDVGSDKTTYIKIAELVTAIGAAGNDFTCLVACTGGYGYANHGVDLVQASTRNSSTVKVKTIVPAGGGAYQYGYVVNKSTGNTEIWIKREAFACVTEVYLLQYWSAVTGNLQTTNTEPNGIVYVNRE